MAPRFYYILLKFTLLFKKTERALHNETLISVKLHFTSEENTENLEAGHVPL